MNARKIVLIVSLMIMSTIAGSENSPAATWQKNIGRTKVVEIESSGEATSDSSEEFQEAVESLPSAYANGQTQIEKPNKSDSLFTPQARIIGGSEIVEDRYPWLVAMYKKNFKSNSKAQLCGGSLITPNIVLSAAHCLDRVNHVNVGRHHLIKDDQDNYEEFNITEKVAHPGFDPKTYDNDFALFKLSGRSKFKTISLSGMTSRYARTSDMLDVIGWGMTKSDMTNPSLVPLEAQVQILDNQQCQQNYFFTSITDNMMCAAYDGRDACQGDSGGPLIIKGNNAKQDVLAGIVSFGSGCANGKYPGVYARVSSAIGWIATNALALSKASPTSIPTQAPVSPAPTNSPIEVPREKNYPARVEVDTYEKPSTLALHPTPFPVQAPSLPTVKLDQPKGEQLFFTGDDISKKIKQKKIRPRASDVASSIEQRSSAFGSTNSGTEDSSDAYSLSCNTKIERISQLVASLLLLHFIR